MLQYAGDTLIANGTQAGCIEMTLKFPEHSETSQLQGIQEEGPKCQRSALMPNLPEAHFPGTAKPCNQKGGGDL